MDHHSPNGHTPKQNMPDHLHFERSQVTCQRCHRTFEYFILEEIGNLRQLRIGDMLVVTAQMQCLHCGKVFRWDLNDKKIEEMAITYGAIVKHLYAAE